MDEKTIKVVNNLFQVLQRIFPAFRNAWPTQEDFDGAKREWVKALMDAEIRDIAKIQLGVKRFRSLPRPFVPSPGEFIKMCTPTPEEMGLPNVYAAYREAVYNSHPTALNKQWSHEAVEHAWKETGARVLSTFSQQDSFKLFEKNYLSTCEQILNGLQLQPIQKVIEPPIKPSTTKTAFAHLGKLKELLK